MSFSLIQPTRSVSTESNLPLSPTSPTSPDSPIPEPTSPSKLATHSFAAASFFPDNKAVVVPGGSSSATLYSLDGPSEEGLFNNPKSKILSIAVSQCGRYVATGNAHGTTTVWDAKERTLLRTFPDPRAGSIHSISFNHDASKVASSGKDHVSLWVLGSSSATVDPPVRIGIGHPKVNSLVFSPASHTGDLLAIAYNDHIVRVHDTSSAEAPQVGRNLSGHQVPVHALAWSPDGNQLLTCDRRIAFWSFDPKSKDQWVRGTIRYARGHQNPISSVAFSPDGRYIVSASKGPTGSVRIWNSATREQVEKPIDKGLHPGGFALAAFSPDGRTILTFPAAPGRGIHSLDVRFLDIPSQVRDLRQDVDNMAKDDREAHLSTQELLRGKAIELHEHQEASTVVLTNLIADVAIDAKDSLVQLNDIARNADANAAQHATDLQGLRKEIQDSFASQASDVASRLAALQTRLEAVERGIEVSKAETAELLERKFKEMNDALSTVASRIVNET